MVFDKLKKAGGAVVDSAKATAQSTAESMGVDAQVKRALDLMERTAKITAKREGVRSFRVTTRVDLGLIDIGLEVEYDPEKLKE